jgi:hypothetical protein
MNVSVAVGTHGDDGDANLATRCGLVAGVVS